MTEATAAVPSKPPRVIRPTTPRAADGPAPLGSPFRAILRLTLYLGLTVTLIPVQAVAVAIGSGLAERLPVFYHRLCWRILGLQVECRGTMSTARPTLFVSNHSSYADITVLGGLIPGCFVAKAEVAAWPLFGLLAKLQRTVFIDRQRRSTRNQRDDMAKRLEAGQNLILFPEGTSDDGNRLLPFRSALFSTAERRLDSGAALPVQPVSIVYARLNGIPIGRGLRPFFAWYGDMELAGHLWCLAGLGKVTIVVEFHQPVSIDDTGSRKALAEYCQRAVADGMVRAITGRPLAGPAASAEVEVRAQVG
ncbi:lysophospholipid acyltransferase family protein [Rhodospirillaceae bacterium SYSU D60014]|uniref:lysophospholipid acyltransferase family protein n=1 Tax=Virgifigura deserti TaxID=2268457 RepID=UPI000E669547